LALSPLCMAKVQDRRWCNASQPQWLAAWHPHSCWLCSCCPPFSNSGKAKSFQNT